MKFGIVTPTYNRPRLLHRAIESVLANDYDDWMMCIVDDCSEDESAYEEIVRRYANDSRIKYIRLDTNSGVNIARNRALDFLLKNGCDFITFLDDDDFFREDALQTAHKMIMKYPGHKWFVSKCAYKDGEEITQVERYGTISYRDYMAWTGMRGDATHFIARELTKDVRFCTKIKQGQEWIYFIHLQSDMLVYDHISKIVEYLEDGLTKNASAMMKKRERALIASMRKRWGVSQKALRKRYLRYRAAKAKKEKAYLVFLKYVVRIPFGI